MNPQATATKPKAVEMALVKIKDRSQITLPPDIRKALNVDVGDYLETEVVEGGVLLKPVAVVERTKERRAKEHA